MKYLYEIDGLRAVAVTLVILFHLGFESFSGGFVGVDVFFVISGYLITSLIIKEIKENKFSLLSFFSRRARRILPALFFYIFISLIIGLVYFPPHNLKDLGQSIFSISLFVSNIFFYIETDYFKNTTELSPLLHTWSLSIETQYYFFYPILIIIFLKINQKIAKFFWISIGICSLLLSEIIINTDKSLSFFMLFTRFWELLIGGLLVFIVNMKKNDAWKFDKTFQVIGLLLILISSITYSNKTNFPGIMALPPVIGTMLIIISANKKSLVTALLNQKNLRYIGLISYSLYLSHFIIFTSLNVLGISLQNLSLKLMATVISFILAIFSYHFIEIPSRKFNSKKLILYYSLIGIIFFMSSGLILHKTDGLKNLKLNSLDAKFKENVINAEYELKRRQELWEKTTKFSDRPYQKNSTNKKILILGDSKSQDLFVSLALKSKNLPLDLRLMRLDDDNMENPNFISKNNYELENVIKSTLLADCDEVVLTNTWKNLTNNSVKKFVLWLKKNGKKVSIIGTSNFNDVASLSYVSAIKELDEEEIKNYVFENIRLDWRGQFLSLKKSLENDDISFHDKLALFCNFETKQCEIKDNKSWFFYDSGHLTIEGANYFGSKAVEWFIK